MDVIARSGTSLFLSPDPRSVTAETKPAMREAMALAAAGGEGNPVNGIEGTTPEAWEFRQPERAERTYAWSAPDGTSSFLVS